MIVALVISLVITLVITLIVALVMPMIMVPSMIWMEDAPAQGQYEQECKRAGSTTEHGSILMVNVGSSENASPAVR